MVETSGFLCTVDVDTLSGHIAEWSHGAEDPLERVLTD
jgi:hypothetical protein